MRSTVTGASTAPSATPDRLRSFAAAIDAIGRQARDEVGEEDLRYIRTIDHISRASELLGRALIAVSPGPISFGAGVLALWVHKQLQATEIGHSALHGAYNRIEGAGKFHSRRHRWQIPIDERAWIRGHNGRHHGLTNVAGHDADINFGPIRLTPETPHRFVHYFQLPFTLLVLFPNFAAAMNLFDDNQRQFVLAQAHQLLDGRDDDGALDNARERIRQMEQLAAELSQTPSAH